jgi:hypothetical protein
MNNKELIAQFERNNPHYVIAHGGDGTLLKVVEKFGSKKSIIPIRDYARCEKHANLLEDICLGKDAQPQLKHSKAPFLEARIFAPDEDPDETYSGIAEIVLKSYDPTEALRFSVVINNQTYMKQCIADGLIFASKLGSHGYFKSVTRMLFTDNDSVGLGFIAPTYGICNLILKQTDKVCIQLERGTKVSLAYDKNWETIDLPTGAIIDLCQSCEGASLFGYDIFCCPECRHLRNSTMVNDQYLT